MRPVVAGSARDAEEERDRERRDGEREDDAPDEPAQDPGLGDEGGFEAALLFCDLEDGFLELAQRAELLLDVPELGQALLDLIGASDEVDMAALELGLDGDEGLQERLDDPSLGGGARPRRDHLVRIAWSEGPIVPARRSDLHLMAREPGPAGTERVHALAWLVGIGGVIELSRAERLGTPSEGDSPPK